MIPVPDDGSISEKRAIAGRKEYIIEKRAASVMRTTVGNGCQVSTYTKAGGYPGGFEVTNVEKPGAPTPPSMVPFFATASYWYIPSQTACVPTIAKVDSGTLPELGLGVGSNIAAGRGPRKFVNIDHVYELKLLDNFFETQLATAVSCKDIQNLFDKQDMTQTNPDLTRLNSIFAQLPSYVNADFIGMDAGLNAVKGVVGSLNACTT